MLTDCRVSADSQVWKHKHRFENDSDRQGQHSTSVVHCLSTVQDWQRLLCLPMADQAPPQAPTDAGPWKELKKHRTESIQRSSLYSSPQPPQLLPSSLRVLRLPRTIARRRENLFMRGRRTKARDAGRRQERPPPRAGSRSGGDESSAGAGAGGAGAGGACPRPERAAANPAQFEHGGPSCGPGQAASHHLWARTVASVARPAVPAVAGLAKRCVFAGARAPDAARPPRPSGSSRCSHRLKPAPMRPPEWLRAKLREIRKVNFSSRRIFDGLREPAHRIQHLSRSWRPNLAFVQPPHAFLLSNVCKVI